MVRTSTSLAVISGFVLMLGLAGSANATNALNLVWKANGLTTIGSTSAAPPPSLEASVILTADSAGVSGAAFGFVYDFLETSPGTFTADGNELNGRPGFLKENGGPAAKAKGVGQFAGLNTGNAANSESGTGQHGQITGFDSGTLGNGCVNCTITLGSALFTTTANTSSDNRPDVKVAFLLNGVDGVLDNNNVLTTNNSFGSVNVLPEPMAGVFGAAALGALALLARRRN